MVLYDIGFTNFVGVCILVLILAVFHFKYACTFWAKRGVPQISPSFPFGNMGPVFLRKQNLGERIKDLYDITKSQGNSCVGLYFLNRPAFVPVSPELVKNILTKDFQYFHDRGIYYDEVNDPLSAHLFSLSGMKWRNLRTKFSPAFTSGKLKYMLQTVLNCGNQMMTVLLDTGNQSQEIEMKDVMARFTTDVIGSCAFGLDCNSMKNPKTEFRLMGKRAFTQTITDMLKIVLIYAYPKIAKIFGFGIFAPCVTSFFYKVVKDTMDYRENNNVTRSDFLQLLIQLKQKGQLDDDPADIEQKEKYPAGTALTMDEAAAQAFIFFLAGMETTAATMSFAVFEMCANLKIQERARAEVKEVLKKHNNQLTYEALTEMHYLDTVIAETLRKYPPAPAYARKCTEDYPILDTNAILPKDMAVLIPVLGLHRDSEYFPNPDEFDPERFNEENKSKIIDYTYIPFGDGPRICIGQRFALIQVKVGLSLLLKNFTLTLNQKTSLPLKMETKGIVITPITGIWVNLEKINAKNGHT